MTGHKRPLIMMLMIGMGLELLALVLFLYVLSLPINGSDLRWLPSLLAFLLMFVGSAFIGNVIKRAMPRTGGNKSRWLE